MHWLKNKKEREQAQTRPGPGGRTNGQGPQRPTSGLNRWLLVLVGIMLVLFIFNYVSNANQSNNSPQRTELTYTQFYQQIQAKNVATATFIGQADITGTLRTPMHGSKLTQYHVTQLPNADNLLPHTCI